jgi:16S rRNA C967 or C1407 C5-methylase (RsmB/RsmF family)/NOL1/NOP2/fmu family ribosome biogenesis protein
MNFPPAFELRVKNDPFLGEELLQALNTTPPISIRLNPKKATPELDRLSEISWCKDAFYLQERPVFTLDPLFHAGCYYPQEAGSMVLHSILNQIELPDEPMVLDLCAAPGGKSTLISSFFQEKGVLVSNEVIQSRSRILKENMTKWGNSNSIVTNNDPKDFERLPDFFDLIVVDAPCSGEGMFRKDPESRNEWSEDNVHLCSSRQKRIVADVWDSLKPGAFLIYSTCTFNEMENEENVQFAVNELGAQLVAIELPAPIKKGRKGIGHYCLPGTTETEGFYIAVLQKEDGVPKKTKFESKKDFQKIKSETLVDLGKFVKMESIDLFQWNGLIIGLPKTVSASMQHLIAKMRIVKAGTVIGEMNRKGLVPHEELALSQTLCSFKNRIELTKEQSLLYLHGDTFPLNGETGWQLITYRSQPLGWIKHLGNRFNNLYPKEWRIRMRI